MKVKQCKCRGVRGFVDASIRALHYLAYGNQEISEAFLPNLRIFEVPVFSSSASKNQVPAILEASQRYVTEITTFVKGDPVSRARVKIGSAKEYYRVPEHDRSCE
jgi:hypothetical protein